MPHITKDKNPLEGHRSKPGSPGEWETLSPEGVWEPASDSHFLTLDSLFPSGGAGGFTFVTGQKFQAKRAADGSIFAFDTSDGTRKSGDLAPAAPADPARPDIKFFTDPNTGTFFKFDANAINDDGTKGVLTVESEAPERGFQHILEAVLAINEAGLNPLKYNFVFEDGRVIPKLVEQIPPNQDSFSTAVGADGQLLAVSRLTGTAIPIGATPKAADIPPDATVELDPVTKQFKITQPNGQISFLQAPVDIKLPQEVTTGGQVFAFNPNTGQFQQVQVPRREFEPDVVTIDGREFIQGPNGQLTPLAQQFNPDVVIRGGRAFIQGPGGELTPLGREEVPNLDELINERILSGDAPGALALADFRDRPTSREAFSAAMQFAQSPGDVAAISAIARGQSLVAPPPSGTVQRIAEQPEFLQDAFQRLINQFRGGTGSPEEFIDVLTRINREREEQKGQASELEKELAVAQDKLDNLALEQKLDKLRKEFADALKKRDTTVPTPTPTPTTQVTSQVTAQGRPLGQTLAELEALTQAELLEEARSRTALSVAFGEIGDDSGDDSDIGADTSVASEAASSAAASAPAEDDFDEVTAAAEEAFEEASSVSSTAAEAAFDEADVGGFDFFRRGGRTHHGHQEIVGEDGPELVDLPPGTKVTPISKLSAAKIKKLKEMGIRGMQEGGIVDPLLPFGVRRALAGVIIEPTRRRLSRAAGLPVLSAQARQNLLPEELEVFNRLSREAGIPEGAFRQEQESAFPGANLARGRARFAPRVLR